MTGLDKDHVLSVLGESGYRGRIVSIHRLQELQEAIDAQHREGLLDEVFYRERLVHFTYGPPGDLPEAQSLIVVAFRDPMVRFVFRRGGKPIEVNVPPTYLHALRKEGEVERLLAEVLAQGGYRVTPAVVPEKLLAVRSGLAAYGRNNITYVPGMGSYQRPAVFYSDLPCTSDEWCAPRSLEWCERCTVCARACPTGAIARERFLLHAERCITYRNEKPVGVPFPSWLDTLWHNCLVGCMICQTSCPANRGLLGVCDGCEFSDEETGLLLDGLPVGELPAALVDKLETWDLLDMLDTFPRNLGVLVQVGE